MASIKDEDQEKLAEIVQATDASIAKQKQDLDAKRWTLISEALAATGTEQYPVILLSLNMKTDVDTIEQPKTLERVFNEL